jgi:hypothetical protein
VLLAQQHDNATSDRTITPRVTWQDQQQPPAPPQRVEIEQLPDDPISLPTIAPTITVPSSQPTPVLPPPPRASYDVASVSSTAINLPFVPPSNYGIAVRHLNTSDRVAQLSARINDLETELTRSRADYSSTD